MNLNKLLITLFLGATFIFAHEEHNKKKSVPKLDTLTIVGKDTIAINGIPTKEFMAANQVVNDAEHSKEVYDEKEAAKNISFESAFEHMHNKLIHFPIALTLIALMLLVVGYKENKYLNSVKIIVPFATILTILTVITGEGQTGPFEGTASYALVETHELLGFGVLVSLIFWSIALYVDKMKNFIFVFAVLTFILVSIAGLYGGVIAH